MREMCGGVSLTRIAWRLFQERLSALGNAWETRHHTRCLASAPGGFPAPADPSFIDVATRAAIDREELVIQHRSLPRNGQKPKTKARWIRPYFLLCVGEAWYLYGYDLEAKAIRRFSLTRIQRIEKKG